MKVARICLLENSLKLAIFPLENALSLDKTCDSYALQVFCFCITSVALTSEET